MRLQKFIIILILHTLSLTAISQNDSVSKGNYYRAYPKQVTTRVYLSKKYTDFSMRAPGSFNDLKYRANNAFNAGVGATYGAFTLNLGFNMGFLDRNRDERGKTKFLDLQTHIYPRKWVIDFYGQFYRGYFLTPKGTAAPNAEKFYLRPDIKVDMLGVSVFRLLQPEKLSYRAAFLQTEWQKKSAGSWLLGFEFYTGRIRGDSALLPTVADDIFTQQNVRKLRFIEFGPGAGYAYTAVIKKHFFITGSVTVNADISFVRETVNDELTKKTSISPNITARAVGGYNNDKWSLALSWVNNSINLRGRQGGDTYLLNTGNIRLSFAKRFRPGKKLRKKIEVLERK